jgi:two-component system OmpR family sensor kinase
MLLENSKIDASYNDFALYSDIKLLSLALKNLIDNAIKYSKDKKASFYANPHRIDVASKGEPLIHPLEYYVEPFSQEQKRASGFGLGLYIVNSIVLKLGYKLEYQFKEGSNIFSIVFKPSPKMPTTKP